MDSVKAKANFARLSHLLIDKGGEGLRRVLLAKIWPSTLVAVLNAKKLVLQNLKKKRVINDQQWDLLYPTSGTPDFENFDITLLTVLIRNIVALPAPATGWSGMPRPNDHSASANVLRIRLYRNEIYAHAARTQIDDTTFENFWRKISQVLRKLLVTRQDIDGLRHSPMSPEEEIYVTQLKECEERDKLWLKKINNVEEEVKNVKEEVKDAKEVVKDINEKVAKLEEKVENPLTPRIQRLAKFNFSEKIKTSCEKFQDGTRKWFFDILSNWFSGECRVMILTAGPGIGKTVLAAKICELYQNDGNLAAFHFCDYRYSDCANPSLILQWLARQMCENVNGFCDKLDEATNAHHSEKSIRDQFRVLLHDPLQAIKRSQPMLIVIDALDETKHEAKSEFLDLISEEFSQLPKWIKILITSRPELQVGEKLKHFKPFEIKPDSYPHQDDLKAYIQQCFPIISEGNVTSLVKKCQGSFLFAYLMVTELKEKDTGIDPNPEYFSPKGIFGFYKKQFERLMERLENFSSCMEGFLNVVAAASGKPLPIRILLSCMGLTNQQFKIRKAIIKIMTEILPVYDDHITVYHKSLIDWLRLDGYEEHEFVADVTDGTKRLWLACKEIFEKIKLLNSVSDFKMSSESKFALTNGVKFLIKTGDTKEFGLLANVRINFLRLKSCPEHKLFDYSPVLIDYKEKISDRDVYWKIFQHNGIFQSLEYYNFTEHNALKYLKLLANGHFDYGQCGVNFKNVAESMLANLNELWLEDTGNAHANSNSKIVSHAIFDGEIHCIDLSPDENILVSLHINRNSEVELRVLKLPNLTSLFFLSAFRKRLSLPYPVANTTFSPDSSFFVYDSVKSCVSIAEQKEIPFIPHGPDSISCCSFSSCGSKLVTFQRLENSLIQMWDVTAKDLLVEMRAGTCVIVNVLFSSCSNYVVGHNRYFSELSVWDSNTLTKLDIERNDRNIPYNELVAMDNFQLISESFSRGDCNFIDEYFFPSLYYSTLPTGETIGFSDWYFSKPFLWKSTKCFILSYSKSLLMLCDSKKHTVVETIDIGRFAPSIPVYVLSKSEEKNLIISLNKRLVLCVSLETLAQISPISDKLFLGYNSFHSCTLSPNNLFIACCYSSGVLVVRNVDSGETLQTFQLNQPPNACFWSESYLWVVCKGKVVTFPYQPSEPNVLGNDVLECSLDFYSVLVFAAGILVVNDTENVIDLFQVFGRELRLQKKFPLRDSLSENNINVSADGRAVIFVTDNLSMIQLLEMQYDGSWKLTSKENLNNALLGTVKWFGVIGGQNSQCILALTEQSKKFLEFTNLSLDFLNLSSGMWKRLAIEIEVEAYRVEEVIYVEPDILILKQFDYVLFIAMSNGKILGEIHLYDVLEHSSLKKIFYIASHGTLIVIADDRIKCFKIHNIKNRLNTLPSKESNQMKLTKMYK